MTKGAVHADPYNSYKYYMYMFRGPALIEYSFHCIASVCN